MAITQKNIKITFLAVFLINLFVLMINLPSQLLFIGMKMLVINLLMEFLKSFITVMKKYFNEHLIIMKKTKKILNQVTLVAYVKNSLKMKK